MTIITLNLHAAWFSLYPKQLGGYMPPGISSSKHGMKLKVTP